MALEAPLQDGPTAAIRLSGMDFESNIYSRHLLGRLSIGTRSSPPPSTRVPRARSAEPNMSGYYHHPGDEMFPNEPHSGQHPLYLEGMDASLEEANNASYAPMFAPATQEAPQPPFITPPTHAFNYGFIPTYAPSGYTMDPNDGFPPGTYSIPGVDPVSGFPVGFDPMPDIGATSGSTHFETPTTGPVGPSYLSPNPHSPPARSSRSGSPNSVSNMDNYGILQADGTWMCAYPGCRSTVAFVRPCDLRKHYHRHEKRYFCSHDGCERSEASARRMLEEGTSSEVLSTGLGYGTRKDRDRHERTHNPSIPCPTEGCTRRFARTDNMRDHHKRIHQKGSRRR